MKERPILFSGPMIRAILEGRKTMTRRVVKDISSRADGEWHPFIGPNDKQTGEWFFTTKTHAHVISQHRKCPYGQPGDRLWVKEAVVTHASIPQVVGYVADGCAKTEHWEKLWNPRFMPRWASRILLEVVSVRVERLQDISITDCLDEGVRCPLCGYTATDSRLHMDHSLCETRGHSPSAIGDYSQLWDSLYTKEPEKQWNANPWVWVIEFKRVTQ